MENVKQGVKIADAGGTVEPEVERLGFRVIRNLVGHGVGKSLHEAPHEIPCFYDSSNHEYFQRNTVVAVGKFVSTRARYG